MLLTKPLINLIGLTDNPVIIRRVKRRIVWCATFWNAILRAGITKSKIKLKKAQKKTEEKE